MAQAIANGHISGDGLFSHKCHELLQKILQVPRVLLTTSCTDALEIAAHLLELQPGDEVIVPSFTFISTANAFVLRLARPVFVDVRPDTLNLDERKLEALITPSVKAIITVHYGGVGCEMDDILEIGNRHGLPVVEDNAHGLFGKYKGKYLGTLGCLATQSFHETKNVICGEGGALLINDPKYIERAEVIREKGSNRIRFLRGEVDKYGWVDIGSSFLPSELNAAYLFAQLEQLTNIQEKRTSIWEAYREHLSEWAHGNSISLPKIPDYATNNAHMFYLVCENFEQRSNLIQHLKENDILSVFHYLSLHNSQFYKNKHDGRELLLSEFYSERLLRLPLFYELETKKVTDILTAYEK